MVKQLTIKDATMQRLKENKKDNSYSKFLDRCLDTLKIPPSTYKKDKYEP